MQDKNISTNEILKKQFSQLPEIIQDIILESNWKEVLRRITNTYKLHIDQGGYLEAVTLLTMLGLEESSDYIKNIEKEVKITNVLATEIAKEVEVKIFQKIREDVMNKTTKDEEVKNTPKPIVVDPYREKLSEDNVEILNEEEEKKEDLTNLMSTKEEDGVEILEEGVDEKINEELTKKELSDNIDLISDEDDEGVEILDRNKLLEEIEGANTDIPQFTPKANTDLQKEVEGMGKSTTETPTFAQKPKPVQMRTLKSDIVNQKISNPGWVPKIARKEVVSKQTKSIIDDAKKEIGDNQKSI